MLPHLASLLDSQRSHAELASRPTATQPMTLPCPGDRQLPASSLDHPKAGPNPYLAAHFTTKLSLPRSP